MIAILEVSYKLPSVWFFTINQFIRISFRGSQSPDNLGLFSQRIVSPGLRRRTVTEYMSWSLIWINSPHRIWGEVKRVEKYKLIITQITGLIWCTAEPQLKTDWWSDMTIFREWWSDMTAFRLLPYTPRFPAVHCWSCYRWCKFPWLGAEVKLSIPPPQH